MPKINNPIEPVDILKDNYPTHRAKYGQGGVHSVKTIKDRDNIPYNRLEKGMLCYVEEDNSYYSLEVRSRDVNKVVWVPFAGGGGGGGSIIYTTDEPTTVTVGGIPEGSTFPDGISLVELVDRMLHPYKNPSFTAFSMNVSNLEVGQETPANIRFAWTISTPENAKLNTLSINYNGADLTMTKKVANGNETIAVNKIKKTSPASVTATISCQNSKGATFTRKASINWMYRVYWGNFTGTDITGDEAKANLKSTLKTTKNGLYTLDKVRSDVYVLYPAVWGKPREVKYPTPMNYGYLIRNRITITNDYGVAIEYIVVRSTAEMGSPLDMNIVS